MEPIGIINVSYVIQSFTIMKNIILQLFITIPSIISLSAQVTSVDYLLDYNCETNLYEVKLKVLEGSATTIQERAQFNAEISFVVPTGTQLEIVELINPIEGNQYYEGTEATEWHLSESIISHKTNPMYDFHITRPKLTPASFYSDLSTGDEVILFICKIGDNDDHNPDYRFYNNETDYVKPFDWGLGVPSNLFMLGSQNSIYKGNQYKSCITDIKAQEISSVTVYPNPSSNIINLDLQTKAESISIIDYSGTVIFDFINQNAGLITIDVSDVTSGIYMLNIKTKDSYHVTKIVKQ